MYRGFSQTANSAAPVRITGRISVSSGRERAVRGRNEEADARRHGHRHGARHEELGSPATEPDGPIEPNAPAELDPPTGPDTPIEPDAPTRPSVNGGPGGSPVPHSPGVALALCPTCSAPLHPASGADVSTLDASSEAAPRRTGPDTDQLLDALRASESRFRAAFADAGIGMALIDSDDLMIEANPAFAAMLGREVSELVRLHIHKIIDPEDTPRRLYRELVAGKRERVQVEKQLKHRDGRAVWANVTISLIRDGAGLPLYTLAMFEDITERRSLGDRLKYQASHDPLTKLPNRTYFFEQLDAACLPARRSTTEAPAVEGPEIGPLDGAVTDRRVGVCYLDLDGFAAINDTLGHHIGDQLLIAVAARLERRFAQGEGLLVARLGGDEFALLVADSESSEQLTLLAAQLLAVLEQPFDVAGHRLAVTASVGVVERSVSSTSPTDLVKDADATLYWSKADGRARWTLYDRDAAPTR